MIAQQLISYHQLSRLRKSATAAGLSHCELRRMALTVEQMFYGVCCDKRLIYRWSCGPCKCSGADSDQNTTGQVWYRLTEVADFQVVRILYLTESLEFLTHVIVQAVSHPLMLTTIPRGFEA